MARTCGRVGAARPLRRGGCREPRRNGECIERRKQLRVGLEVCKMYNSYTMQVSVQLTIDRVALYSKDVANGMLPECRLGSTRLPEATIRRADVMRRLLQSPNVRTVTEWTCFRALHAPKPALWLPRFKCPMHGHIHPNACMVWSQKLSHAICVIAMWCPHFGDVSSGDAAAVRQPVD